MSEIKSSQYAKLLKDECLASIPRRKWNEILLLASFLILFTVIASYLWINVFIYDYWFYIMIGVVIGIVFVGYLVDRKDQPDWKYYLVEIIKELKKVDTIELSDFLNEGQPFFGANLGNCEKFLKIAEKLVENETLELVIRAEWVYLKGFEPPEEEKQEENEDKNA